MIMLGFATLMFGMETMTTPWPDSRTCRNSATSC
jgi:hypothetical protein